MREPWVYLHAHRLGESNMLQDKLIDAAQHQEARPLFAAGPLLTELLSDPIMHMLMAADRVEYRDIEAVLQRARAQLGIALISPRSEHGRPRPASRRFWISFRPRWWNTAELLECWQNSFPPDDHGGRGGGGNR